MAAGQVASLTTRAQFDKVGSLGFTWDPRFEESPVFPW